MVVLWLVLSTTHRPCGDSAEKLALPFLPWLVLSPINSKLPFRLSLSHPSADCIRRMPLKRPKAERAGFEPAVP